jgi:hypothetical protein
MTEAIFGLIGVLIGSSISWLQTYWVEKRVADKNARYLAIRVVCILDKYLEDCTDVVLDDGLCLGQRTKDGYLEPQVKAPHTPVFPDDVDWKSIDHELMYMILSLPAEVESAERLIKAASEIAEPPNYEDWFDERKFHYCGLGLMAYKLANDLSTKYNIKKKTYNDWDHVANLKKELEAVIKRRQKRMQEHRKFVNKILGDTK